MRIAINWENWLKKNFYLLTSLIFSVLQLTLLLTVFGVQLYSDSLDYIGTVDFILGKSSDVKPQRLLRPLGPLFATIFQPIVGSINAFGIENAIFFILSSILVYLISNKLYSNKEVAFFASVLFSSSEAVITWGIAVLTDMGVWFFYLLSIFLTLHFFEYEDEKIEIILVNGAVCGLGILMKENAVAGAIFFILMVLFSKRILVYKFRLIALFGVLFLIPIAISQAIVFQLFQYTYLDWYFFTVNVYSGRYFTLSLFVKSIFVAFTLMLIFFLFGLWKEIKEKDQLTVLRLHKFLFLTISSSIPIFLWTILSARFLFLLFPTIIPISAYGLMEFQNAVSKKNIKLAKCITILVLGICVIFNYIFLYFRPEVLTLIWGIISILV